MKCVYSAATSIEAYMVLNLLEQEGIQGRVDGEYLQGGMGELQAFGLVRVMVGDDDFGRAQNVVEVWEKSPVENEPADKD